MEHTKKKRIGLVAVLAVLLLVIGGVAAVFLPSFLYSSDPEDISGEVLVADEETLVKALKSKKDCTIIVTEDIVVSKEVVVNGKKHLSGGTIIMNMYRVGSGESVLAVSKGATLVLDGATVDGNGVVNCISVKAGGKLEVVSGSLIYGYPYGLDVSGTVDIADIKIDEALHTGINVAIFGDVNMRGGSISNNVYGVAVAEDARMEIADGVTMTNSYASFVINYGEMDISGGKYDGAGDNAIENWGKLSVRGTAENPVEICNGTKSALNSKNKSTLTAEHIKIYDMGWHGMCIEKNSTANLKNIYIENAGKSTLYVSSSKASIEDATIIGGAAYAVYGTKNAQVTLKNVTIKDTNHRGIMNEDSTLEVENLTITGTAQHGVYAKGAAVTNINNATISTPGVSAVAVAGGEANITNTTIENTTKEGISVGVSGKAKIENVTITAPGNFGIANYGGTVEAKDVKISDSGNAAIKSIDASTLTVKGATITNAGAQAISIEGNSVAGIADCQIDKTKNAAVYIVNSTVTMQSSTVKNAGTYAIAVKDSKKSDGKKVHLDNITVKNAGEIGIGNINSYVLAEDITVNGTVKSGIYTQGAASVTNMNRITVTNTGTCGFGFNGGEITARNVTISNTKTEGIYAKSNANVKKLDNVVIKNPGTHGIKVEKATVKITVDKTYNPANTKGNGVTIQNPASNGIRCVEGVISAVGVTISNAKGQGINVENESTVTIDGCVIDTTAKAAVYAFDSSLTLKNATIRNAGTVAISAKDCKKDDNKKVQLDTVTIHTTGAQGIVNNNSYVLPQNIQITNSKQAGIYTEGADSVTNMNQVEIVDSGTCGFGFKAGEVTARNVTILNPKNEGIVVQAGADVKKLDNVTVKNPGTVGIDCQGGTTNITVDTAYNPENTNGNGITIENPGTHGINISKGASVTVNGAAVSNAGDRGISSAGTLELVSNGITIDGTKGYGVYLTADASLTGIGLHVKNTEKIGIFSEGANVNVSNLTIEKTAAQGIQLKAGEAVLSNITLRENGSAAVRVMNDAKVTLNGGTIYAYNYGIAADGTSDTTVTNVTVERASKDGKYTTNALVHIAGNAKLEITDTIIDGKYAAGSHEHAGRGVELKGEATLIMNSGAIRNNMAENGAGVAMIEGSSTAPVFTMNGGTITGNYATVNGGGIALSNGVFTLNAGASVTGNTAAKYGGGISMAGGTAAARPSFILNGGSITGNTASGGADMNCTGGSAKIKLGKALTAPIYVKPNTYASTRLMAEKYGDISDADFAESMEWIIPDDKVWIVASTGYLSEQTVSVTTDGVTTMYGTLEEAIAAANASAQADTVTILKDVTVEAQLEITDNVTITSNKAVTITGTASVFKVAAGKSLTVTGTEDAKISIVCSDATADVIYNGGSLSLEHVNISGGYNAIYAEENTTTTLSQVAMTDVNYRGIHGNGALIVQDVTIDGTTNHGIYLGANASITGSDLTVKNMGNNGIFSEGANMTISGLTIENTSQQGVQVKGGTIQFSDFTVQGTGSAAVRVREDARMTLNGGTIYADTYGIAVSETSNTIVTDVTIERTGKKTDALVNVAGSATLELSGTTKIDGKGYAGHGVNVAASTATFTMNGGTITGNTAEGYADVALASDTTIQLNQALTVAITVKPNAYAEGRVIAENAGELSGDDFASSMKYIVMASEGWHVADTGALAKTEAILDGVHYTSLEAAITAAEAGATVKVVRDVTLTQTVTKAITLTADKAVTVTASDDVTSHMFSITSGTLTITGASADARITLAAGTKTLAVVHTSGGDAALTNVIINGNTDSTVTGNKGCGIRNEGGTVTAKSVTIQNIVKGDGIYTVDGAIVNLDNVSISCAGKGRYGIAGKGTINVTNAVDPNHALSISDTVNHGIEVQTGGKIITNFTGISDDTYVFAISNTKMGIILRAGAQIQITNLSVHDTSAEGIYFVANSAGSTIVDTVANFEIKDTAKDTIYVNANRNLQLTNGTISKAINIADTSGTTVTQTNVTVQN